MKFEFRNCEDRDCEFILYLKELGMKWYIEKIYGWDIDIQREKTKHEIEKHKSDMRIIRADNNDIGVTTFYKENNEYVVGLIIIHPDYRGKGIATNIIMDYINIAKKDNKNINIKTCKYNPARQLYEKLGFKQYNEDDTHVYLKIKFSK